MVLRRTRGCVGRVPGLEDRQVVAAGGADLGQDTPGTAVAGMHSFGGERAACDEASCSPPGATTPHSPTPRRRWRTPNVITGGTP